MIDYAKEPQSDIAFFDMKSFYASVECVERGLNPLTTSLCVMSRADNSNGLILASSPVFKNVFGKSNVGRAYDLPFHVHNRRFNFLNARKTNQAITAQYVNYIEYWARRTFIVPPRMDLYILKNMKIQSILKEYASEKDIHPYSIDEGFIDLSQSLNYFISDPKFNKKDKLNMVSSCIQNQIWRQMGLATTVGMSNSNPLLAKLALDNEAKNTSTMRANWSYEDVPSKVWGIQNLTDFWGIGPRLAKRLNKLKIYTIRDLAFSNPDLLKKEFGVIGVQLWFHAHGVDESNVHQPYRPMSKGLGNSQVLPRDYYRINEIELVLKEMTEQVAIRLRKRHLKTTCVYLSVTYSRQVERPSLRGQMTIEATHNTKQLIQHILQIFHKKYEGGPIRQIAIRYSGLVDENYSEISLFEDYQQTLKEEQLQKTIDQVRYKYGFLALQNASVLTKGSRSIARSKLVGGHSAGGLDGLQ